MAHWHGIPVRECVPKVRLKFRAILFSGRVRAMRVRSALSRCRRFMMLWVSWPLNEGPLDRGLLSSVDAKRAGTWRRARQAGRRPAPARAASLEAGARPLGILPASRDMA